jgi:hypothetical protein
VRHELVYLTLSVPEGDVLLAWAADAHRRQAAALVFTNAAGGGALETLLLPAAYCVSYEEQFVAGDAQNGAYVCHLVLSEPDGFTMQAGGPATFWLARAPPVGASVPTPIGADEAPKPRCRPHKKRPPQCEAAFFVGANQ